MHRSWGYPSKLSSSIKRVVVPNKSVVVDSRRSGLDQTNAGRKPIGILDRNPNPTQAAITNENSFPRPHVCARAILENTGWYLNRIIH